MLSIWNALNSSAASKTLVLHAKYCVKTKSGKQVYAKCVSSDLSATQFLCLQTKSPVEDVLEYRYIDVDLDHEIVVGNNIYGISINDMVSYVYLCKKCSRSWPGLLSPVCDCCNSIAELNVERLSNKHLN